MRGLVGLLAGLAAVPQGGVALAAQTEAEASSAPQLVGRSTIYPAAYFAPFAPASALEIARRVPGFSLDLGNTDARGFAGTAGNVVINGARPSSKSDSLETVLARIPALQVVRVELAPGDLFGADYSGKPQVLNIVLGSVGGLSGTLTASATRHFTGEIVPNGQVSVLWKRGASSINLAAGLERFDTVEEGTDRFGTFPEFTLLEFRRKVNRINDRAPYVSGNYALEQAADRAVRFNIRFSKPHFTIDQTNRVEPTGGVGRDDTLREDYRTKTFEAGGDVTRPLAKGAIKLVGLATRTKRDQFDGIFERLDGETVGGFEQRSLAQRNETIGRLNWTRDKLAGMRVEVGAEAALNTLDSNVEFVELLPGGGRDRIDLPIDDARVREKRGQLFANVGRDLSPVLRAEAGLAYETSRLTVSGDASAQRSLSFFKPSLSVDWHPKGGWHVQASIKRTVAQLDFYDFISNADLASDRVSGGNAELVPQRAWEARATIERPILGDGLVKLDLGTDRIDLLQDRILTPEGFDAPGNLGRGTRKFAALTLDLPLTRLGIKGGRLKANGQLQSTRVLDPVSGTRRAFTGFWPKWEWSLDYRQDRAGWAYGAKLSDRAQFAFYRINEIDANRNIGPQLTAFIEVRPRKQTVVTFNVDNLLDNAAERFRLFSLPSRAAPPSFVEYRRRSIHRVVSVTLKQNFD